MKKQVCYRRDRIKKEDGKIPAIQQCMVGIFSVTVCNAMTVYAAHFTIDILSIRLYTIN